MSDAIAPIPRWRARTVAGRTVRRWLVDILMIVLGVTSVVFEPFSIAIHSLIGLVFVAVVGPHLWDRRRWIRGTFSRLRHRRGLPARQGRNLAQALLLLALTVVVTVFGLWDWLAAPTKIRYHAIAGVILIAVAVWHGWTRRRSLVRWRIGAGRRPGDAGQPGAAGAVARGADAGELDRPAGAGAATGEAGAGELG